MTLNLNEEAEEIEEESESNEKKKQFLEKRRMHYAKEFQGSRILSEKIEEKEISKN